MPTKKAKKYTIPLILIGLIAGLMAAVVFLMWRNGDIVFLKIVGRLIAETWWIILPIPMWKIFMMTWEEYTETKYLLGIKKVLLEVIPPSDVEKSPKIMEQVFSGLHTWSGPNLFEQYCGWRPKQDKFSFEIVSTEGRVHFYIRCPLASRDNVESQIYAQYPDAEIYEVEDYTNKIPMNIPNPEWDLWGSVLHLVNRNELPIRTHRDFLEDVTGKMIDPLASMTEVMSTVGMGQHIWFQVVFSPIKESMWHPKCVDYIEEIIGRKKPEKKGNKFFNYLGELAVIPGNIFRGLFAQELNAPEDSSTEEIEEDFNMNRLSPADQERVKAIYHNISKVGFATVLRLVYVGKREYFNKALGVAGMMGAMKQFSDPNLNAIRPDPQSKTFANYHFTDARLAWRQRRVLYDYRDRNFNMNTFVFNTEELATIFHFPDMSAKAPSLTRIEAKKGEAPPDLPIEFEPLG